MLDRIELISLTLTLADGDGSASFNDGSVSPWFSVDERVPFSKNRMKIFVSSYREQNHEIEDSVG